MVFTIIKYLMINRVFKENVNTYNKKRAALELPSSFPRLTKTIAYENRIIT